MILWAVIVFGILLAIMLLVIVVGWISRDDGWFIMVIATIAWIVFLVLWIYLLSFDPQEFKNNQILKGKNAGFTDKQIEFILDN